jgi:hypothetical protein
MEQSESSIERNSMSEMATIVISSMQWRRGGSARVKLDRMLWIGQGTVEMSRRNL